AKGMIIDVGVQVTEVGEALRHTPDGEVGRLTVPDLVPPHRRTHQALRHATDRVGRGDRVVPRILVVVDEEFGGVAVLAPPRRGDVVGRATLDLPSKGERSATYVGEAVLRGHPDVDVKTAPTTCLGVADCT